MNRRIFLERMAMACASSMLLSPILSSCAAEDEPLFGDKPLIGKRMLIVGAGISGLYAAYLLQEQGATVTILEASNRYGGRIRPLENFSDFSIELGAEEVHGSKSIWYDLIRANKAEIVTGETEDYFFIGGVLYDEEELASDPKFVDAMAKLDNLANYIGEDITAKVWVETNIDPKYQPLFTALIGNEHGTSNDRIGMFGIAREEQRWTSKDDNFLLKGTTFLQIMESSFASIMGKIILNKPVESIDYQGTVTKVKVKSGEVYEADSVIVTVPLAVFDKITYTPALHNLKNEARQVLGMGAGMKIILKFSARFWDNMTGSIYSSGYVPEFWSPGTGHSAANNVLTAFVHGEKAEYLSSLGAGAVDKAVEDLKAMYGSAMNGITLLDSYIMDWGKEPYIGGTYSFPKVGSGEANRILAFPANNKVFFAGEATNYNGHFATVHGAMETGYRAAAEILEIYKK